MTDSPGMSREVEKQTQQEVRSEPRLEMGLGVHPRKGAWDPGGLRPWGPASLTQIPRAGDEEQVSGET